MAVLVVLWCEKLEEAVRSVTALLDLLVRRAIPVFDAVEPTVPSRRVVWRKSGAIRSFHAILFYSYEELDSYCCLT